MPTARAHMPISLALRNCDVGWRKMLGVSTSGNPTQRKEAATGLSITPYIGLLDFSTIFINSAFPFLIFFIFGHLIKLAISVIRKILGANQDMSIGLKHSSNKMGITKSQ